MRTGYEMSIDESLKAEMQKVPLPKGVTWSNVFQLFALAAVAEKKKWSDERFERELAKYRNAKEIQRWIREVFREFTL